MTTYSYAQLEGLWIQAGGDPAKAPLMAAIAMAESGGNDHARNPSGATGLWQILVPVHGDLIKKYGDPNDPVSNAKEAVSLYKSQGLGAWTTYSSGAYQKYLKQGVQPVSVGAGGGAPTSPQSGGSDASCCAIGFGGVNIPLAGNQGGFCLLSKTQLNSLFGLVIAGAGIMVGISGMTWMLVYAFKKSGAANVLAAAPGPAGAVGKVIAAPSMAGAVRRATPARATGGGASAPAPRSAPPSQPLRF